MCILHTGLFDSCDSIYDYNWGYIRENILEQKLQYLKTKYSEKFCTLL